ncbi:MAG: oxidoreductase [Armatimonadetes bacterium]|nr:oxidoreductase [Armatimonadota bacterium]
MSTKPKVGFYWCASCGGCEESFVDVAEAILDLAQLVEFAIFPVAMDFKRQDVEALDDGEIFATMINGAIRTSEQEEMCHLLRRKSQVIIAYGSCAYSGGIPALANLVSKEALMKYVYEDAPTVVNPDHARPQTETLDQGRMATLPEIREMVRSLDQVIEVDYSIPGCAPNPKLVLAALQTLLSGERPPKGAVLAPNVALCANCPRIDTKPRELSVKAFKRPHLHEVDPDTCLLAQGFLCMGPATRSGCGEACIRGNMPCTGCYGPVDGILDQGAKILTSLASLVEAHDEAGIDHAMEAIVDPVGSFYRYGMAKSLLRRKIDLPTPVAR